MQRELIVVGTGLFAQLATDYFSEFTDYTVIAYGAHRKFVDDDSVYGLPLVAIEELEERYSPQHVTLFVAIGYARMNRDRQRVYEELKGAGYRFASFVHPNVRIWSSTSIGDNVFIFEDNTVQGYTRIGDDTVLWSGNHIGHHSVIGNHCFISSHVVVSGSCRIGDNVFIGVNASLHDAISVADETLVGAGAIVSNNTERADVLAPSATKKFPKKSNEIGF